MFAKWAVVAGMVGVAAIFAVPTWFAMRAINHFNEKRRAKEEEARSRAADAAIVRVREAIKYGRRLD